MIYILSKKYCCKRTDKNENNIVPTQPISIQSNMIQTVVVEPNAEEPGRVQSGSEQTVLVQPDVKQPCTT